MDETEDVNGKSSAFSDTFPGKAHSNSVPRQKCKCAAQHESANVVRGRLPVKMNERLGFQHGLVLVQYITGRKRPQKSAQPVDVAGLLEDFADTRNLLLSEAEGLVGHERGGHAGRWTSHGRRECGDAVMARRGGHTERDGTGHRGQLGCRDCIGHMSHNHSKGALGQQHLTRRFFSATVPRKAHTSQEKTSSAICEVSVPTASKCAEKHEQYLRAA